MGGTQPVPRPAENRVMLRLRFDRGTLVVHSSPRGLDAAALPDFVLDSRDGRLRAPAAALSRIESRCRELGHRVALGPRSRCESPPAHGEPPLRPYQAAALTAWELARRRGIVVLPTGGGKTRVALAAIARAAVPTLCVVPTRILLHQWIEALRGAGHSAVGQLGDGVHALANVTVATFESAYRQMSRIGDRFGLLVVDEAHHFGLGVRDELLAMTTARFRLGLTATPREAPGTGDPTASETPNIGPVVFRLGLSDLAGGHLAPFERILLPVALSPSERNTYEHAMSLFREAQHSVRIALPDCTYRELVATLSRSEGGRRALAASARARSIVQGCESKRLLVRTLLQRLGCERVLVFTGSAEVAHSFAREFLVHPITAEVGRAERTAVVERFRSGGVRALVAAQVLNEGFDVPEADVAIITSGTRGVREHIQRVGRVLRPSPGKRATVYELVCRDTYEVRQAHRRGEALAS